MRYFHSAILVALLSAHSLLLPAQSPAPQAGFTAARESLSVVSDTIALKASLAGASRSDLLQRGLLALRLGELGADPDFSQALSYFGKSAEREPGRPEGWYGLGLAEAGRSEWEMRDRLRLGSRVGLRALERSSSDNARALAADPRFTPAALALARVELTLLDTVRLKHARDIVRRSVAALSPPPPDLLLAWGRLERAAGRLDSAHGSNDRR